MKGGTFLLWAEMASYWDCSRHFLQQESGGNDKKLNLYSEMQVIQNVCCIQEIVINENASEALPLLKIAVYGKCKSSEEIEQRLC